MWADLWGDADDKLIVANEQLEASNKQIEKLQLENKELSQESSIKTQTTIALGITAAVLLITTLTFAVLAFRRKTSKG